MFPIDNSMIIPKWGWHNWYQLTLARIYPSGNSSIIPKWDCHDCSQVRLAPFFPSDTGTIDPKWNWHDCSEKRMEHLFPSDTGTIVPKRHWYHCSQADFYFLICILFRSLFFGMILHFWFSLGKNCVMYQNCGTLSLYFSVTPYFEKGLCSVGRRFIW